MSATGLINAYQGNDFYRRFLDEGLQYSCAYFMNDDETLEQAQCNKLWPVAVKLSLSPGLKILDIGSGWGEPVIFLACLEDVEVLGITLSKEPFDLANARALTGK